jgi:hypothetical protein
MARVLQNTSCTLKYLSVWVEGTFDFRTTTGIIYALYVLNKAKLLTIFKRIQFFYSKFLTSRFGDRKHAHMRYINII